MKKTLLMLVAALCLGFWLNSSQARATGDGLYAAMLGLFLSYEVSEEFEMSIGIDDLGNHLKPTKIKDLRHHYNYPAHYGRLFDISQNGTRSVFWFKTEEGILRNMVIANSDRVKYRIQPFATERFEAKWLKD